MRVVAATLLLAGCQLVFPLEDDTQDDFDPCSPQIVDPLRYFAGGGNGFDWATSNLQCESIGMELAVFDTQMELDDVRTRGAPPYWIGVMGTASGFTALDRCPDPLLAFAAGEPSMSDACVALDDSFKMATFDCTQTTNQSAPIGKLCETPRPDKTCAKVPVGPYTIGTANPVTYATAAGLCTDIVEISSSDELAMIDDFAAASGLDEFWVSPQFSDGKFTSADGCPSVFRWQGGEPQTSGGATCVVYVRNVGMKSRLCSDFAPVLCEH